MAETKETTAKDYKIQQATGDKKASKLSQYTQLMIGENGIGALIKYELITTLCSGIPGALGLLLRSKLYPMLLGKCGRGVVFGKSVDLRHPGKIEIGDNTIIDDNCLLDAKGSSNAGIKIGNNVYIGRNTILSCKNGDIILKDNVNIGFNCEIFSSSKVELQEFALLAAYCYVVGGGNYSLDVTGKAIAEQPIFENKGVLLEKNCWLGARVTVLDGVTIGHDSAIGTAAMVNSEIPPFSIAVGTPAKVVKKRE